MLWLSCFGGKRVIYMTSPILKGLKKLILQYSIDRFDDNTTTTLPFEKAAGSLLLFVAKQSNNRFLFT